MGGHGRNYAVKRPADIYQTFSIEQSCLGYMNNVQLCHRDDVSITRALPLFATVNDFSTHS